VLPLEWALGGRQAEPRARQCTVCNAHCWSWWWWRRRLLATALASFLHWHPFIAQVHALAVEKQNKTAEPVGHMTKAFEEQVCVCAVSILFRAADNAADMNRSTLLNCLLPPFWVVGCRGCPSRWRHFFAVVPAPWCCPFVSHFHLLVHQPPPQPPTPTPPTLKPPTPPPSPLPRRSRKTSENWLPKSRA
jgi:hypothetical protein